MTLGSLFDGSGGFPLAGVLNGIIPLWASEIEPYPLRVTAARFPDVVQLGDVTKINGADVEPVDIITFGSPCQDLSAAGKQMGIHDGKRSNLFFEAIRIIKEMRNADTKAGRSGVDVRPRYAVWENVPGAFSSNRGDDFRAVIEAFANIRENGLSVPRPPKGKWNHAGGVAGDGWSLAWRTYDAQYWGVPQRRKRIYLIADFASERAGEILFERESMCRDSSSCREAWQVFAPVITRGVGGSCEAQSVGFSECYPDIARSLCARHDSSPCLDRGQNIVVYDARGNGCGDIVPTLTGDHQNRVTDYTALCVGVYQNTGRGWWNDGEIAETLRTPCGGDATKANLVVALDCRNMEQNVELSATLQAKSNGGQSLNYQNPICYCVGNGQLNQISMSEQANTLDCMHDQQAVIVDGYPHRKYIVRRLTPLECSRLQGFPDWWMDGVEGSDSAKYKMWGNGIALPCAYDVLKRIANDYRRSY